MKIIFSDFDGTLTNDGHIGAVFFDILNEVKRIGAQDFIIVSGRSVSWGHFFMTHFPLTTCIMEGGGVLLYRDDIYSPNIKEINLVDDATIDKLEMITQSLLKEIPATILSADSFGRRTDRAIEIYQQTEEDQKRIENFLKKHNVNFSKSNVHLNFWLDDLSKANAVKYYLDNFTKDISNEDCLFFGDAANDESMFKVFSNSVGVSNIQDVLHLIEHKPSVVLEGLENAGAQGVLNYLKIIS